MKLSVEPFLECVKAAKIIKTAKCIEPGEYKRKEDAEECEDYQEREKKMQFLRDHEDNLEKHRKTGRARTLVSADSRPMKRQTQKNKPTVAVLSSLGS